MSTEQPPPWVAAREGLDELQQAAGALALLQNAQESGLLRALAEAPVEADGLADSRGVDASRVEAVLQVLAAHGITRHGPDGWQLAPGWDSLVSGESPVAFDGTLALGRVWAAQFAVALDGGEDYWQLEPADRLAVAAGISPDPSSPATVAMARAVVAPLPGVAVALEDGGRVLELGCGLASRLCALLQAFPRATAVGVELDPALVDAARERARGLGLGDRLELVAGDAASYDGAGSFALANWSQFFFPEASRAGTLAAALRSLSPGGWISMPVIWTGEAPAPGTAEDRELAEMRLVLDLWGVPMRTIAEVVAEVTAAGFVDVHGEEAPGFHVVRGRRP